MPKETKDFLLWILFFVIISPLIMLSVIVTNTMNDVQFYYGDSVIHRIETVKYETGAFACTPCIEEPIKDCEFKASYKAIKDTLDFKKGDIFSISNKYWVENIQFCNELLCYDIETMNNESFFKPISN